MQRIIYTSPNKIEWDAQSAFKITNYYTDREDHMVFCYLKQYVQNGDLKLCTFCFDKEPSGRNDLQLCLNLNPVSCDSCLQLEFGIDGIEKILLTNGNAPTVLSDGQVQYHSFRSNDQQGYYWCGEIPFRKEFIEQYFHTFLEEKSIILLNFYKTFKNSDDYACLFPDNRADSKCCSMQEFVVLNY